jgi:hypothetical protein
MAVAVASSSSSYGGGNVPQYSGNFIPEIWSGKLIQKFYDATVLAAIANTDYEGEIKRQGDKVVIRTRPTLTIKDYAKGAKLEVERPDSPAVELIIDKAKYFNAVEDDIDRIQSDINLMDVWATDASEQMKQTVDRDVLSNLYSTVDANNKGNSAGRISGDIKLGATGSPVVLTAANVIDSIIDAGTVLDEQNCPENDRYIVIPSWMAGMLKKSDLKQAYMTGDAVSPLRNGKIGMIDRFTVYISHHLPAVTDGSSKAYHVLAGHKAGLTFASQLLNTETLKSEQTFGQLIRGLQVYGYETVKPDLLVDLYVAK